MQILKHTRKYKVEDCENLVVTVKTVGLSVFNGYRAPPYGVRARISSDGGATWGPENHHKG